MCMVMPIDLRSLTRRTLLMTSRPRSSNTSTFQIGLPSASSMGATGARSPLALASSDSLVSGTSFRLRIFLSEADENSQKSQKISERFQMVEYTYLSVS